MAKPFLKWAGGKGKLAPRVCERAPERIARYHEPFLGGGAVFYALQAAGKVTKASLSDGNAELIGTYQAVKVDVETVIVELSKLADDYLALDSSDRHFFYSDVRDKRRPQLAARKAARLLFLNKTCFNGLYRVNRQGRFNVPHGRYDTPGILDPQRLRQAASALASADIRAEDFEDACARARPGDFVYLDPPYQPLSETSHFTSYTRDDFSFADQERLRDAFDGLTRRDVPVLLSNSDHPAVRELYGGYAIEEVTMGRNINSKATERSAISELLIDNFEKVSAATPLAVLAESSV